MNLNTVAENYERSIVRVNTSLSELKTRLAFVAGLIFAEISGRIGHGLGGVGGAIGLGFICFFMGWAAAMDFPNLITQLIGTLRRLGMTIGLVILAFVMIRFIASLTLGLVLCVVLSVYVVYSRVVVGSE